MERFLKMILKLMFKIKGYQFYQVQSQEENAEAIAFGAKLLQIEGYDDAYIEMIQRYFPKSELFIARHRGQLIGAVRLLNPEVSCRIMDFWNLDYPKEVDMKRLRELGMLAVDKKYRGKSRLPITGLIEIAYQYSLKNGIRWWIASSTEKKYEKFKAINPNTRILNRLNPTARQQDFQSKYAAFFDAFDPHTVLFLSDLKDGSYTQQIKRMIQRKLRRK